MLTSFAKARAWAAAVRSWRNRVPWAIEARPRSRTRSLAGSAGEDTGVVLVGLGAVQRRLQARPSDRTAGAQGLGRRHLGDLPGLGEEQLGVDRGAGGLQPPVPLPVGPLERRRGAGELLVGGGQPLGQRWLPGPGAELPADMAHIAVGHPQAPGELAGAQRPAGRVLLVGVPELGDPLASGRRTAAQGGELLADLPLVGAQLPGELTR